MLHKAPRRPLLHSVAVVALFNLWVLPYSNAFFTHSPRPVAANRQTRLKGIPKFRPSGGVDNPIMTAVDVVVVGSCNMDLVAYTCRLPAKGETVTGTRFEKHFGGKGANQAVMASRIGVKVAMVACVGEDDDGAKYLNNLMENEIDCNNVRRTHEATGVAQLCVEDSGANFIIVVPGANYQLTPADVATAGAKLKGSKVIVCQGEMRPEATLAALELGRSEGMLTVFNPAPAVEDLQDRYLTASDVIVPNETELEVLCRSKIDPGDEESVCAGAEELIERGAKDVIVTLGSRGCMWVSAAKAPLASDGFRFRRFLADEVVATDTVGAGDAFVGALAAYLSQGLDLESSIGKAVGIAGISVTRAGAQESYPRRSELPQRLRLP